MESLMQSMKGFNTRYIMLGVVGIILLMVFSFLTMRLGSPVMTTLYSNLSNEDSATVVTELGRLGINFDVQSGGSEIKVNSTEVLKVRMMLAEKGLPNKATIVGYEIFDKESTLGTSNFVMNVNLVRALEGELARTISALDSIKSARVHLVIPKRDIFKRTDFEPTASVILTLNNRLDVAKKEALSVRHIVSSSVPGLKPDNVTIVDNNGKILAKAKNSEDSVFGSSGDANEYKIQTEERMKATINEMLEQALGPNKVQTQLSIDMSFEKKTTSSEVYDPDSQVARSTQTNENLQSMKDSAAGEVSIATELSGETAAAGGSNSESQEVSEITNYEISKTITNVVSDIGVINKISVAVLVDGKYQENEDGNEQYIPRTDEEMDQIRNLVSSAIGYNEERGDIITVVNMPFSRESGYLLPEEGPFDWLKRDLSSIIKTVVIGFVSILTIMFVVRPLINKAFDVSSSDVEMEELKLMAESETISKQAQSIGMVGGTMGNITNKGGDAANINSIDDEIDLNSIQSSSQGSIQRKVNDIIENNPEQTLSIIRNWMADNK